MGQISAFAPDYPVHPRSEPNKSKPETPQRRPGDLGPGRLPDIPNYRTPAGAIGQRRFFPLRYDNQR